MRLTTHTGSPIGATLAFMLIQHKAEIGIKHVTDIVIFSTKLGAEGFVQVHMVFKVADVDNPFDVGIATRSEDKQYAAGNLDKLDGYDNGVRTHVLFED
ncbi:hypothetical protein IAQ61_001247 [Plenodomus lingam]|uniref:uncharacterized protein n=1 Tax=Leptosphaeria maculans TaxID=5022 RepID=UPI003327CC4C|nr:hypothetical protein IAQ61_001247 [Plenodomus lingam]